MATWLIHRPKIRYSPHRLIIIGHCPSYCRVYCHPMWHIYHPIKHILTGNSNMYEPLISYLQLLVSMLKHPSGRIATEQINVWSSLFRDPLISKSILLRPFCGDILTAYMDHMIKIRWEDIENETHPHLKVIEASYDDEDEYDIWMGDLRSRASLLFRFMGHTEPQIVSQSIASSCPIIACPIWKWGAVELY